MFRKVSFAALIAATLLSVAHGASAALTVNSLTTNGVATQGVETQGAGATVLSIELPRQK
ncbi:MAG: hypothetical protein JO055_14105 [Alphaproteobacteria bacterium]|nr:hypothetical protein [Alphaproteobacteria bacterium]